MKPLVTRYLNGEIRAYPIASDVYAPLEPAATYKVQSSDRELVHAVAPNLDRAVYATPDTLVCINQSGDVLWNYELEPRITQPYAPDLKCVFSLDGAMVWVYRPDAMADRGPDLLVVLRAETGEEVARRELESVGQGAVLVLHPDGRHILFDVGEGQDGVKLYRAALTDDHEIDLHSYAWDDRCLVDVAPDGRRFMTVDHGRCDVAFHAFPGGEVELRVPIEDLGHEYGDDEACVAWNGGFLDTNTAVVTVEGERDDKEWHCHYSIDLGTGMPIGRFEAHSRDSYDLEALGDGTWVVSGPGGGAVRYGSSSDT